MGLASGAGSVSQGTFGRSSGCGITDVGLSSDRDSDVEDRCVLAGKSGEGDVSKCVS